MGKITTRTVLAGLLCAPLVAGAAAPALAAPPVKYTASGDHVEASGQVVGVLDGIDGNVHDVYFAGDSSEGGSYGYGFVASWSCEEGVTQPYDPETGEELCDFVGYTDLESYDVNVALSSKLANGSLTGTYTSVVWECDDETGECWSVPGDISLLVDLDVTATSTKPATYRFSERFRDPETGYSYRGTMTQRYTTGPATGTVDGEDLLNGFGLVGTFTFRAMEKL